MKRHIASIFLVLVAVALPTPRRAQAQESPPVQVTQHATYVYGSHLSFTITATASDTISELVLILTPEANIRVDLMLIWPILLIVTIWFSIRAFRQDSHNTKVDKERGS